MNRLPFFAAARRVLIVLPLLPALLCLNAHAANEILLKRKPDGSRSTAVHRIPLYDADGEKISVDDDWVLPFSTRFTCGECHDYEMIRGGWHFNAPGRNSLDGRPGQPWILANKRTGTQLPVSNRQWEGTWRPADIGLSPWQFVKAFGSHMPGGGMGEIDADPPDIVSRWHLSGKLEINCMACHSGSPLQDQSEWAIQVAKENFAWGATAAGALATVSGAVVRLPDTYDLYDGPDPDNPRLAPPSVELHRAYFDLKSRAFFDISERPENTRCYSCHSTKVEGTEMWETDEDVHLAAGLACVDCHRNGLDHQMTRGYQGEAADRGVHDIATLSCEGCHLGDEAAGSGATGGLASLAGRLGAPRPLHKGLPSIHLEKMTCTSCHSGPWPEARARLVRTSRAHKLGIQTISVDSMAFPYIVSPVFARSVSENGKIAPHNMMWPAFWGRVEGEGIVPILPQTVAEASAGILNVQQQVAKVLRTMAAVSSGHGEPVFLAGGKVYRQSASRGLEVSETARWPQFLPSVGMTYYWGREKDGEVVSLFENLPSSADELDADVEIRIFNTLQLLADLSGVPGEPVLNTDSHTYKRNPDGFIDVLEHPGTKTVGVQLVFEKDGRPVPLFADFVVPAVVETVGSDKLLTERQMVLVLEALADAEAGQYVYISGGKMFRLGDGGAITASDHPAAEPYSWPIAHDVRPARRALGTGGCTDCHTSDAPFFFGIIEATGPLRTAEIAATVAYELQEIDPTVTRLFGWTFRFRPLLKTVGFCASALVLAILLLYGLAGLRQLCKRLGQRE